MISIYTWFFTAVSFRNMTGHLDIFQTYLLRPSGKVHLYYLRLLSRCQYVFTVCYAQPCVSGVPAPSVRLRQRVWHVFWIRAQGLYRAREQGPPVCSVFPHSSALTSAQFQEGRWNDCVREEAPLTSAVWLAYPGLVEAPIIPAKAPTTMQSKGCFTYHMLFCSRS